MSTGGLEPLKETIKGRVYMFHATECSNGFKGRLVLEL
jgi:hypothetical protein